MRNNNRENFSIRIHKLIKHNNYDYEMAKYYSKKRYAKEEKKYKNKRDRRKNKVNVISY